jgi:DNA-binding GntR family transcriptional regulator
MQPSVAGSPNSQPERIRLAIVCDIEDGTLSPGTALDEKSLAHRFGVSRTPVREALLMLAAQHLVHIAPRSGIQVHAPQAAELVSLLEALAELEAVVTRLCTQRMSHRQREDIQLLCAATSAAATQSDRLAYEQANQQFHEALYAGCGNEVVVHELRQIRLRLSAFRRKVRDQPGRLASAAMEHQQIVAGLLANNMDQAAQAMREHISAKGRGFADLLLARPRS